jgi:hypothetical protein
MAVDEMGKWYVKHVQCSGYKKSGYWKGYQCNASATLVKDGKWWCKQHLPIDEEAYKPK